MTILIAAATVSVGSMELKTYPYSDPDPVPCTERKIYPYARYDGSSWTAESRTWKTVTLENEKIRVVMTPEIGGKVWGAVDKRTGVDFIYFNHVAKFRDIAQCGPWTSGGIDFNIERFNAAYIPDDPEGNVDPCASEELPGAWKGSITYTLQGSAFGLKGFWKNGHGKGFETRRLD